MVKVQLDLSEKENKLLNMYRLIHDLNSKPEAIKHLIMSQEKRIEKVKVKNKKQMEEAEKIADEYDADPSEEDEELADAEEELKGY